MNTKHTHAGKPPLFCVLATVLSALLISQGCGPSGGPGTPGPAPKAIADTFSPLSPPPPPDPQGRLPTLNLYLDGSESMRGFVADPQSRYCLTVQRVYQKAVTAQYPLRAFKVSSSYTPLGEMLASELAKASFYDGGDSPLAELLSRVAKEAAVGRMSLIISDFVQSEVRKDQIAMARSLQEIAAGGPEVLLLAFRSSFDGPYFVETTPKVPPYHLKLADDGDEGRPFYMLAVAPRPDEMARLRRYVLTGLGEKHAFEPSLPPVTIEKWRIAAGPDAPSLWKRKTRPEPFPGLRSGIAYREEFEPAGSLPRAAPLKLEFEAAFHFPVLSVSRFQHYVRRATFKTPPSAAKPVPWPLQPAFDGEAKRLGPAPKMPGAAGQAQPSNRSPGRFSFRATFPFASPEARSWDVYRIQVTGGEGNIEVPAWVQGWTTANDQRPSQGNRTLHLELLIEAMVRSITEKIVFFDHFVSLGGRSQ